MRVGEIRVPLTRRPALDIGALPHYWHPQRDGVEQAPADFCRDLALVHPDLAAVRPPPGAPLHPRRWLIWYRKPEVTHHLCPGWLLLFVWPPQPYDPIPLDNRVLANLYMMDGRRFANASQYFERIAEGMEKDKQAKEARDKAALHDRTKDYYDSTKISNLGAGNKFALHHDGTILPSRGERNWVGERTKHMLPADVTRRAKERR